MSSKSFKNIKKNLKFKNTYLDLGKKVGYPPKELECNFQPKKVSKFFSYVYKV